MARHWRAVRSASGGRSVIHASPGRHLEGARIVWMDYLSRSEIYRRIPVVLLPADRSQANPRRETGMSEREMKIAIIGCGLVGTEAAHHWRRAGHEVTGTTTRESRVAELSEVLDHVMVLRGSDREGLSALLEDKDVAIVTVSGGMFAQAGKGTLRAPDLYKSISIDTAT